MSVIPFGKTPQNYKEILIYANIFSFLDDFNTFAAEITVKYWMNIGRIKSAS